MQTYTRTYDAVWGFLDWNVDAADKSNHQTLKEPTFLLSAFSRSI